MSNFLKRLFGSKRRPSASRRNRNVVGGERLERRELMAGCDDVYPYAYDVSNDGAVAPLDALLLINALNAGGSGAVAANDQRDVSRDGFLSPLDALLVINYLNAVGTSQLPGCGNLFVTMSAQQTPSSHLLAGTLAETVISIDFHGTGEAKDANDVTFYVAGDVHSIERFQLYKHGENVAFATATQAAVETEPVPPGVTAYRMHTSSGELIIPGEQTVRVDAVPFIRSDANGAIAAESVQVVGINVEARGVRSHRDLTVNDGDTTLDVGEILVGTSVAGPDIALVSNVHEVVFAELASVVNAGPATAVLSPGFATIASFTFTAAVNQNVYESPDKLGINDLTFYVTASPDFQVYGTSLRLSNHANASAAAYCHALDQSGNIISDVISGNFQIRCLSISASIDTLMGSGEALTFDLKALVIDEGSSVQVTHDARDQFFLWYALDAGGSTQHQGFDNEDKYNDSTLFSN